MGWYFSNQSRSELIRELIQVEETPHAHVQVLAHALRGNVLWSVAEITVKQEGIYKDLAPGQSIRTIRCDLLQGRGDQWGYKPMDESMHPYYYSCPLRYLEMADELCREWREGVRAYHARRAANSRARALSA
jgi:hypothetical protein